MGEPGYTIVFPAGYHGQWEEECVAKGRLAGVFVDLGDGRRRALTFVDMARLTQSVDDEVSSGRCHYTEPGLVVVTEVTRACIAAAVAELVKDGFFDAP